MTDYTQSTFTINPPIAGAVGDIEDFHTAMYGADDSKTTAGTIPFGRAVTSAAATPNVCALPTSGAEANRICGISIADHSKVSGAGYSANEQVRILKNGRIRVYFETAMADQAIPYVRITESAGGAADQGQFRNDADGGKAVACPCARVVSRNGVIAAAGVGCLEVSFGVVGAVGATGPAGPAGPEGPTGPAGPSA